MNDELDQRLGALLRVDSPPARDPLFRIRLVEARERSHYLQRQRFLIAITLFVATLGVGVLALLLRKSGMHLLPPILLVLFAGALIAAGRLSIRGMRQALRWMRDLRSDFR